MAGVALRLCGFSGGRAFFDVVLRVRRKRGDADDRERDESEKAARHFGSLYTAPRRVLLVSPRMRRPFVLLVLLALACVKDLDALQSEPGYEAGIKPDG